MDSRGTVGHSRVTVGAQSGHSRVTVGSQSGHSRVILFEVFGVRSQLASVQRYKEALSPPPHYARNASNSMTRL